MRAGGPGMAGRKKAKSIVLKGVRSPERLLDETSLFEPMS
jgi:hypothetical protein